MAQIRKIKSSDNIYLEYIIKTVMTEFGANGSGFSIHDDEVLNMYSAYNGPGKSYYVIEDNSKIYGGAGIAQLDSKNENVCELKKMYISKEFRGRGYGKMLLDRCIEAAIYSDYEFCYIETFSTMKNAKKLYLKNGFNLIDKPIGNTGHFSCDIWLLKKLNP